MIMDLSGHGTSRFFFCLVLNEGHDFESYDRK